MLENVEDKQSFDYLSCVAKMQQMSGEYREAINMYEQLVDMDAKWLNGYINWGHCLHQLKQMPEALAIYLKAIRVANLTNQEIEDALLYQRAGGIYIHQ